MKKLTTQESNYIIDRLMELMDTEVGKKYTDELLIAMLCIQINELEGKLATEREMAKTSSICDNCATVGCIFQAGIKREKCAFYTKPKTGKWIVEETDEYKRTYCSVCGGSAPFECVSDDYYGRKFHGETRKTDFCPNCGADMRGEE